jgi:hypothetical protein
VWFIDAPPLVYSNESATPAGERGGVKRRGAEGGRGERRLGFRKEGGPGRACLRAPRKRAAADSVKGFFLSNL